MFLRHIRDPVVLLGDIGACKSERREPPASRQRQRRSSAPSNDRTSTAPLSRHRGPYPVRCQSGSRSAFHRASLRQAPSAAAFSRGTVPEIQPVDHAPTAGLLDKVIQVANRDRGKDRSRLGSRSCVRTHRVRRLVLLCVCIADPRGVLVRKLPPMRSTPFGVSVLNNPISDVFAAEKKSGCPSCADS